jgi:hypothetical protein
LETNLSSFSLHVSEYNILGKPQILSVLSSVALTLCFELKQSPGAQKVFELIPELEKTISLCEERQSEM